MRPETKRIIEPFTSEWLAIIASFKPHQTMGMLSNVVIAILNKPSGVVLTEYFNKYNMKMIGIKSFDISDMLMSYDIIVNIQYCPNSVYARLHLNMSLLFYVCNCW